MICNLKFLLKRNLKKLHMDADGTEIIYKKPDFTNSKINIHEMCDFVLQINKTLPKSKEAFPEMIRVGKN